MLSAPLDRLLLVQVFVQLLGPLHKTQQSQVLVSLVDPAGDGHRTPVIRVEALMLLPRRRHERPLERGAASHLRILQH